MENQNNGGHISEILKNKKINKPLRYTIIHHSVRKKLGLSFITYAVIDSVHQLSHRNNHPWCTQSKIYLAKFLDVTDRSVYNAINEGIEKGLLEKNERGDLRTTDTWFSEVIVYDDQVEKRIN